MRTLRRQPDGTEPDVAARQGTRISRRHLLASIAGLSAGAGLVSLTSRLPALADLRRPWRGGEIASTVSGPYPVPPPPMSHYGGMGTVGDVSTTRMGFDPAHYLTSFDSGQVGRRLNGRHTREFQVVAQDKQIEIAPGIYFPAWTFNGTVPGPTLRCREGERVRITFINAGTHPHTMHFHGIHTAEMDGVAGIGSGEVPPGGRTIYEFDAEPFGLHLYHCHALPLRRHIHKGLYGVFIIDAPRGRPPARELVMVMNAFDTNFDNKNEVYAVNTVGFHYMKHPIKVRRNELVRIYVVNMTEFDPINSIHIHGNFFHVYRTGTSLSSTEYTDTIMLTQAERAILEVRFPFTGKFMFHAHQSEFTELGWMGFFEVTDDGV